LPRCEMICPGCDELLRWIEATSNAGPLGNTAVAFASRLLSPMAF
jgi:hypothetical protein